jgi:hypothetical protein
MNVINASIIFLITFLVLVSVFIAASWFRKVAYRLPGNRSKLYKGLLGGYALLLLLAVILYYLFQPDQTALSRSITEKEAEQAFSQFFEALEKEDLNLLNPAYIRETWTFETEHNQLNLISPSTGWSDTSIVIAQSENPGNAIKVDYYITPVIMTGFEITDYFPNPEVELSGDTLKIAFAEVDLNLANLSTEFTIRQFVEAPQQQHPYFYHGNSALIIHLPQNLNLHVSDKLPVHWIRKNHN